MKAGQVAGISEIGVWLLTVGHSLTANRVSTEEISTNILADRRSMMEASGPVISPPCRERPR